MHWQNAIIYEQPVSELMRVFLRLENLFSQVDAHLSHFCSLSSKLILEHMIEITNILDRPDFRTILIKELIRHAQNLQRLQETPTVNRQVLDNILVEIDQYISELHQSNGKFAQALRENEFLMSIRMYMGNPGGVSRFDNQGYVYWLQQPDNQRLQDLIAWMNEFALVKKIITTLLLLNRENNLPETKIATDGFYQSPLESKTPSQLIRVGIPREINTYPEISVGRQRVVIRFYEPSIKKRAKPFNQDVTFQITCCTI